MFVANLDVQIIKLRHQQHLPCSKIAEKQIFNSNQPYVARYGTKNYYVFSVTTVTSDALLQRIMVYHTH